MSSTPLLESSEDEINAGGIDAWNDELWKRVREHDGVPDNFLSNVKFSDFKASGGKGGDLMAATEDNLYIIKELNPGDHASLLKITESYVDHILSGERSLLATIYKHYLHVPSGRKFVVARNLLPQKGAYHRKYDLKGCADDRTLERGGKPIVPVRKRIWKLHMWCSPCMWSDARRIYYKGKCDAFKLKLPVTPNLQEIITKRIRRDTEWLASNNLMDYSLLVGLRRIPTNELESDPEVKEALNAPIEELKLPLIFNDGDHAVLLYIGIIDYLQQWTSAKKVARCIKTLERNKATIPPKYYAERFYRHMANMLTSTAESFHTAVSTESALAGKSDTSEDEGPLSFILGYMWGGIRSYMLWPSYGEKEFQVLKDDKATLQVAVDGGARFKESEPDVFVGYGCTLCFVAEKRPLHVLLMKKGSKMDECGISNDDLLVKINGRDVYAMSRATVVQELQAAATLTFDRNRKGYA